MRTQNSNKIIEFGRMYDLQNVRRLWTAALPNLQGKQKIRPQEPLHSRICSPQVHELRRSRPGAMYLLLVDCQLF
ncbi:hypothetical protein JTB14_002043 [Gonioctena quinquepunctata]|nr:hypothetical protein JTB14_002043 [Gonioctena quinquepunctata]